MKPIEQISTDLFEKLRARSEDINIGDEEANDTTDPAEARFFNFDYKQKGHSFGNITVTIADKKGLKVFYSKNITENDELDEHRWFRFLRGLRKFAMRNLLTFDARDINKDSLALRDIKTFAKSYSQDASIKDISESKLYGTTKSSYQKTGTVKLIVKHSAQVDEAVHGARSRNIEKIFIENSEGERFKLESNNLLAGRVIARHVSNGGAHNDSFAKHVNESINELKDLRYFVLSSKKRQFEDATTTQMVESAVQYYNSLRETLHRLKGQRGYAKYMESFQESTASEQLDEMTEDLKERFIQKYFDQRMEQAIPHIAKAYAATIREAAQVAKQIEQFETGSSRFGLNESDRDMLGLLEFTDKNAFMIKMLENISVKLAESDKVIAKFARHVMENWDSANKTNREMAGKLVRSYVKEIKDIVKKNHSIVEQGVAEGFDKIQEVKKFRTNYGWAGGSKEPRSAHAKQVAAKRKEYEKGLGKFEPTDDMVGTAKVTKGVAEGSGSNSRALKIAEKIWAKYGSPKNEDRIYPENLIDLVDAAAGGRTYFFRSEIEAVPGVKTIMASINGGKFYDRAKFDKGVAILLKAAPKSRFGESAEQGVAEAQLNEGTWVMPLKEKQTIDFIELMSKPLEVGADADSATNALDGLFGDDELFDALANKSDTSISYDARPMVLNRLLQVVAHPQYIKADDVELTNLAKMLTQLKTTDAGKEYASKIDLILEKYPKQPEEDKPEADRAAPTLQPPAA